MPIVIQEKGKKHCRNIRNHALDIRRLSGYTLDWVECLKAALESHRQLIADEMKLKEGK